MKLIQLDVQAFGSFKNRQFHFPAGVTVFYGENEQGKSTLLACLKAMFYGLSGRSRSPLENERLRCQPWDGTRPSASLIIEHAGVRYRLQRAFGKTRAQDETVLMNDISGARIDLPGQQEIGPFLFQVTAEEFTQTVFIGQMNSVIDHPAPSILTKLTNLSSSFNETLSYQAIDSRLQKAQVKLRAERGKGGLIQELEQQLENLVLAREEAVEAENKRQLFTHQLQELSRQKAHLQHQMEVLSGQLAAQQIARKKSRLELLASRHQMVLTLRQNEVDKARHLERHGLDDAGISAWQEEFNGLLQERQRLLQQIDDWQDMAKADLAGRAAQNWRALADSQLRIKELTERIQSFDQEQEDLDLHRAARSIPLWLTSIALILIAAGLVLGALIHPMYVALAGFTALAWTFTFFWRRHEGRVLKKQQVASARQKALETDRQVRAQKTQLEKAQLEATAAQSAAEAAQAALEDWTDVARGDVHLPLDLTRQTDVFLDRWQHLQQSVSRALPGLAKDSASDSPSSGLDQDLPATAREAILALDPVALQQGLDQLTALLAELNQIIALKLQAEAALAHDLDGLSWDQYRSLQQADMAVLQQKIKFTEDAVAPEDPEQLDRLLGEASGRLAAIERNLAALESALVHTPRPPKLVADYDRELKAQKDRLEDARGYYESLCVARSWIQKANDELQATFGPRLNQEAARILMQLTRSRYDALKIDHSFAIQVAEPEDKNFHDWRFFSGGTIDQVYLALRLAIAGILQAGSEPLPLLLDDTLVQYDDGRATAALDYLSRHSEETGAQVLLMTSQARIKEIAGQTSPAISIVDL